MEAPMLKRGKSMSLSDNRGVDVHTLEDLCICKYSKVATMINPTINGDEMIDCNSGDRM